MTSSTLSRLGAVLLGALLGTFLLAVPAQAADRVVTITAEGVTPQVLEVARGDTVTFVNEDASFGYRAVATSDNWDLDSGPVGLLPGRSYTHPEPISDPGVYRYRVAEGEAYEGSVVLAGPTTPKPTATKAPTTAPKPSSGPRSDPSPAATGSAQEPAGGFGTVDPGPTPPATGQGPLPAIALPDLPPPAEPDALGPDPETAPVPDEDGGSTTAAAVPGNLAGPPTSRGYGLPAALAAVLAAGVASLLVRLLLAEPAAARVRRGMSRGPVPVATVD